jgi:hypothetical protein
VEHPDPAAEEWQELNQLFVTHADVGKRSPRRTRTPSPAAAVPPAGHPLRSFWQRLADSLRR